MAYNKKFSCEWIDEVQKKKQGILATANSNRSPIEILHEVFKLCQGDFDTRMLEEEQPDLYQILSNFFNSIPQNYQELNADKEIKAKSRDLVEFFSNHKQEIRAHDVQLFYAILNFVDFLK